MSGGDFFEGYTMFFTPGIIDNDAGTIWFEHCEC